MRVTQPKNKTTMQTYPTIQNQNDRNSVNCQQHKQNIKQFGQCEEEKQNKMMKIRKEYIQRINDIQVEHCQQLNILKDKYQKQKAEIVSKYQRELNEKQDYIRLLEKINKNQEYQSTLPRKKKIDQSKYVRTEGNRHQIPFFDDISDRIDFKIQRRTYKPMSVQNTKMEKAEGITVNSFSTQQHRRIASNSKHKLIPKGKPQQTNSSGMLQFKLLDCMFKDRRTSTCLH